MARAPTISIVAISAVLFGFGVSLPRLFNAFQPLTVALSIMVAAVFVRLNRGMPSLDWKSLDQAKRTRLTSAVVALTREYGFIIAINVGLLAGILTLTVIGKDEVQTAWPGWAQRVCSAAVGAVAALCICRMAYVVWRDLDIVRLQKHLIDASTAVDSDAAAITAAANKIEDIRASGLRRIPVRDPKDWQQ